MKPHQPLHLTSPRQRRVLNLVQRGSDLYLRIARLSDQLRLVEQMLHVEALQRPFEHLALIDSDPDRVEWIAPGHGCECHIILSGPVLQRDVAPTPVDWQAIQHLCGPHLSDLFTRPLVLRIADPALFRAKVAALLPPLTAARLVRLCSVDAPPLFLWKGYPRHRNGSGEAEKRP